MSARVRKQTGARGRWRRGAWAGLASLCVTACAAGTVRREGAERRVYPLSVVETLWRTPLNDTARFATAPEECASAALVGDRVIVGSRAGVVIAANARDGQVLWSRPVSGAVDSAALFDPRHNQVYVGTDDGSLYALDPATGAIKWTYKSKGAIEQPPAQAGEALFVATAADRLIALDARTGRLQWQYDREPPEGFGIRGHAAPRLVKDLVLTGFSDGFLVALQAESGQPVWARSLAAASEQYIDVDTTPTVVKDTVYASSYSGGLYALNLANGDVRWRQGVEGAGAVQPIGNRLYFGAPREGLTALDRDGNVVWRQGLADAGALTPPQAVGSFLMFTGARAGLFVVDRETGGLLQVFNPGRGMCGTPVFDAARRTAFVLTNSGSLYALNVAAP